MEIIHQEKQKRSDFIRNLKPTDVCYINNSLYMVVRPVVPHKTEVLQLRTGMCDYCDDNMSVEPVDTTLIIHG